MRSLLRKAHHDVINGNPGTPSTDSTGDHFQHVRRQVDHTRTASDSQTQVGVHVIQDDSSRKVLVSIRNVYCGLMGMRVGT